MDANEKYIQASCYIEPTKHVTSIAIGVLAWHNVFNGFLKKIAVGSVPKFFLEFVTELVRFFVAKSSFFDYSFLDCNSMGLFFSFSSLFFSSSSLGCCLFPGRRVRLFGTKKRDQCHVSSCVTRKL